LTLPWRFLFFLRARDWLTLISFLERFSTFCGPSWSFGSISDVRRIFYTPLQSCVLQLFQASLPLPGTFPGNPWWKTPPLYFFSCSIACSEVWYSFGTWAGAGTPFFFYVPYQFADPKPSTFLPPSNFFYAPLLNAPVNTVPLPVSSRSSPSQGSFPP